MPRIIKINQQNFINEVINSQRPILVMVTTKWSGPCKMMPWIFQKAAKQLNGNVHFAECDADDNPDLIRKLSIREVPTFLLFENGEAIRKRVGVLDEAGLIAMVNTN